jgi:hypothetical protein
LNKTAKRIGLTAAAALVASAVFAGASLAANDTCTISGNGAFSSNRCRIRNVLRVNVTQGNNANVSNTVNVVSNTGGNHASFNTTGTTSITTGASTTTVGITNSVNSNTINVGTPPTP